MSVFRRYILLASLLLLLSANLNAQNKYFIDGYHGGFWGHYPLGYTGFIADQLDKNSFWKINLEIEPVTWDFAQQTDLANYNRLKNYVKDQTANGRVEFVNPSYGQSYLFNLQGESVIRQFQIGMKKVKAHFPEAEFHTYSSEEPCFTSALPQILKSFGYTYASLKNPNTCWGGYTRAFGGELINWEGSDGSSLLTVPRYETEALLEKSTWQTTAWNNSGNYISSAFKYGIQNPIGMCIQDAGWKNGPWLGKPKDFTYKLWRDYIENTASKSDIKTWNFNQEDVQVSLVWGAQILQKMAQDTRIAENKIIIAEKIDAINNVLHKKKLIEGKFDEAWQNLLLAQHHDPWIVPYNIVEKKKQWNWAEQVHFWAGRSNQLADSILKLKFINTQSNPSDLKITVYNTIAKRRKELVSFPIGNLKNVMVVDAMNKSVTSQIGIENGIRQVLFEADVPAIGFKNYQIKESKPVLSNSITKNAAVKDGKYMVQTSEYTAVFNANKGGVIESLIAKKINNIELVNKTNNRFFNEMRGYFYKDKTYYSSADAHAKITVLESGVLRTKLKIEGKINIHPFTQYVTFTSKTALIDVKTEIEWQGNPGIGQDYAQKNGWKADDLKKAFYNDSLKLLATFPLNLKNQKVYKNAAFDVMQSKLKNTYFNTWDSIKNNIIVNWVDVNNGDNTYGMALLNDHTTNYAHDERGVLGLTLQYSGMGLWGRNYTIQGPSSYNYAILPHENKWDKADIWNKSVAWNEPLQVSVNTANKNSSYSLAEIAQPGYELSALKTTDDALLFRIFNASSALPNVELDLKLPLKKVELIELNGAKRADVKVITQSNGVSTVIFPIQQFGFRTVKVYL